MDYAEDWYNLTRLEYDDILNEEYNLEFYEEENGRKFPFKSSLDELYDVAVEAKRHYDELSQGIIPFNGSKEDLRSELERLRHEWELALDDYDTAYTRFKLEQLRKTTPS